MAYNLSGASYTVYAMLPLQKKWDSIWNSYNAKVFFFSQTYNSFSNDFIGYLYVCSNTILKSNCVHQFAVYYPKLAKNMFRYAYSLLFSDELEWMHSKFVKK